MNFVQTIRRGSHLVDAIDAELVIIEIVRNAMARPTHLMVRTATHRDPVIHWTAGAPANSAPGRSPSAREVVWTTTDLLAGEKLRLEPRPGQDGFFQWDSFELDDRRYRLMTLDGVIMIAEEP